MVSKFNIKIRRPATYNVHKDSSISFIKLPKNDYFKINKDTKKEIMNTVSDMDLLGQFVFYRTYSRTMKNGAQESWNDVVIRVIEGVMTIRKNWYYINQLEWDENKWQIFARDMAISLLKMRWCPPGRGLWAMGTDHMYNKGSACLFNCGAVGTKNLKESIVWAMNALMLGIGVGFEISDFYRYRTSNTDIPEEERTTEHYITSPPVNTESNIVDYVIDDSREGWVDSIRALFDCYLQGTPDSGRYIVFDYSKVREAGLPIKGFGGISSGPEPLRVLHEQLREYIEKFIASSKTQEDYTRFAADCINSLGVAVVSGNVRRSAEILLGDIRDDAFLNLKNMEVYPDRNKICYMSNNSVRFTNNDDMKQLSKIIPRIIDNGEPGLINMYNVQKFNRLGEIQESWDEEKGVQHNICTNPCGEIPLNYYELCNLSEVNICKCNNFNEYIEACKFACFYCSTVNLLKTADAKTNSIIQKNRRIGVSMSGICDFIDNHAIVEWIEWMIKGYECIKQYNKELADEAGIPASIALTTIKPSGTTSNLSNVSPGIHPRLFKNYIRRVRVSKKCEKLVQVLKNANIPYEDDIYSEDTYVFSIPIASRAKRCQKDYTIWEQMHHIALAQKYFVDNMISVTVTFSKEEANHLKTCIENYINEIKGVSFLPQFTDFYKQAPFEEISEDDYYARMANINDPDWSIFTGSNGIDTRFCDGENCTV